MESLDPEVSRVCLDRREMKVPEVSLDPLVPLDCRSVTHVDFPNTSYKYNQTTVPESHIISQLCCKYLLITVIFHIYKV